ncbi:MAG TPA: NAD(P)H-hydrate epimerase [candidate division Zixibacteria bacterium]|nr:NAD(P)H-hydrate epimerase [candidate division Zixibacteria bacterium]
MDIPGCEENVPFLTKDQMVEVDRAMIEDYGIELLQMMENAGRNLAHLARHRFLSGDPRGKLVVILAGTGGNGGGALVCARRLYNYGANVSVHITKTIDKFSPAAAHQLDILQRMHVPISISLDSKPPMSIALIIDGLVGYSLSGAPRGEAAALIQWANQHEAPILSLDAPSGVDAASGRVFDPAIEASATLTLALPKEGLRAKGVSQNVGELYLADISVPPSLYGGAGLDLSVGPLFYRSDIVRLW